MHAAGPPGCGKGTQSPAIKKEHCLCHLATGDMLRAAVAKQTPLGLEAKKAMDSGALVSDELVVGLIEEAMQVGLDTCRRLVHAAALCMCIKEYCCAVAQQRSASNLLNVSQVSELHNGVAKQWKTNPTSNSC